MCTCIIIYNNYCSLIACVQKKGKQDKKPVKEKLKNEKISKYFEPTNKRTIKKRKPEPKTESENEESEESDETEEESDEEEWATNSRQRKGGGRRKKPLPASRASGRGKGKPLKSNGRGKKASGRVSKNDGGDLDSDYELDDDIFQQVSRLSSIIIII